MVRYIEVENFKRAQESCQAALKMAKDLRIKDDEIDLSNNLIMLDYIVQANDFLAAGNYYSAYDVFWNALKNSVGIDKSVRDYIQRRLDIIKNRMNMDEYMKLGDSSFQAGNLDEAEGLYSKAIERASELHDSGTREKAYASLEKIYDKRAQLRKAASDELDAKKQVALSDALKQGDDLLAAGDLDGARKAYLDARNLSDDPAVRMQTSQALGKVSEAQDKKASDERTTAETKKKQQEEAAQVEKNGDTAFDDGDFLAAQMYYMRAIEIYNDSLHDKERVQLVQKKYEIAVQKFSEADKQKKDAVATEQKARDFFADKNYSEAKAAATTAKKMYADLGMKSKVDEMDILLQEIATDEIISSSVK